MLLQLSNPRIKTSLYKQYLSIGLLSLAPHHHFFNNGLLRDVAELLNTKVVTTAAYAPWSNGIVERHNAVIENMILKITHDTKCSVETALLWSLCAKNSLLNNRGYSPNQLVFGRNPNLPSVLSDQVPALGGTTVSDIFAKHLKVFWIFASLPKGLKN